MAEAGCELIVVGGSSGSFAKYASGSSGNLKIFLKAFTTALVCERCVIGSLNGKISTISFGICSGVSGSGISLFSKALLICAQISFGVSSLVFLICRNPLAY